MTTNLETYLGIKLFIQEELDPFKITYLKGKAYNIAELVGFDVNEFFVYVHNLSIKSINEGYFGSETPLSKRIHHLEITFDVNPKQVKKHQIRFYNAQAGLDVERGVEEYYGDTKLIRIYPGTVLEKHHSFNTELITYVSKTLKREDHRKIKITAQGYPTDTFYRHINKNSECHETKIDLHLDKEVSFHIKKLSDKEIIEIENWLHQNKPNEPTKPIEPTKIKEINMDPLSLISTISTCLNIIDKFVGISERLSKKPEKPHSVEARQVNDKLEILRDGKIAEEIKANQLKLNHWDQIRFDTLKKKVDRNWRKYNTFDERLTIAPISEKANLEIEMDDLRKDLCCDFREMIKIFEVTLGLPLSDHYTLYSVCSSELT